MPERTSVTTDATGRRVVAKVAQDADEAGRLVQEAMSLDAGRHPGVVELVGVDGHGVGAVLLTRHVEGPPLAQVGPLPPEEGAGLLAALASILADLHGLGIVHGAVAPEHVVVGPGGRPVLCSFGYGGPVGQAPGPSPSLGQAFTDPAREAMATLDPAVDVFGLGALARFLAPDPPAGHVLGRVAAEATADDPSERPTARSLADALQREAPAARLPRALAPPSGPVCPPRPSAADPLDAWRRTRGRPQRRGLGGRLRPAPAAAAVAAVGLVVAVIALAGHHPSASPTLSGLPVASPAPSEPAPTDGVAPDPTTTRVAPTSSVPTSLASTTTVGVPTSRPAAPASASATPTTVAVRPARQDCPPVTAVLQADVDGDGCPEALRYADGVLDAGVARWAIGRAGDQVAVGNWGCQGTTTLALFRPSTGEVFRFAGWAASGSDLTATTVAVVANGQALRAADVDGDGCHEVVVERAAGAAEVIRFAKAAG